MIVINNPIFNMIEARTRQECKLCTYCGRRVVNLQQHVLIHTGTRVPKVRCRSIRLMLTSHELIKTRVPAEKLLAMLLWHRGTR
jgi:hypothetical protein